MTRVFYIAQLRLCSVLAAVLLLASAPSRSQDAVKPSSGMTTAVDCRGNVSGCDDDFFQTEIGFTRFVRDFSGADVYVLVTAQKTGGGGQRAEMIFEGKRGPYAGRRDTLVVVTPTGSSDDDQRRAVSSRLALGLAGFASRSPIADRISIRYEPPTIVQGAEPDLDFDDPWNHWVFRAQGNGSVDGQASSTRSNFNGSFAAERVTDELKLYIRPSGRFTRNVYDLGDGESFANVTTRLDIYGRAVLSLSDHWSAGFIGSGRRSSYDNIDARGRLGPAIEYNIFPYTESTRRQVRMMYEVQGEAVAWTDTTIYGRIDQKMMSHEASVSSSFAQPWGSTYAAVGLSQYITLPDKYRFFLRGDASMRLTRGLSLSLGGSFSFVRDQIGLKSGDATPEEILTQQSQLATDFDYSARVGLSYTFGSIYNQVVNGRFGGG